MDTTIKFEGLNVSQGESSGLCPSCDEDMSDGEWMRYGVCCRCVQLSRSTTYDLSLEAA